MPPKEKISKEQILQKAFDMTRENGYESITTRKLADGLGCSTQPIFRAYESMEMLKKDLYRKAGIYFAEYMQQNAVKDTPVFLSMGLLYVELAKKENHLFRLLCMSNNYSMNSMKDLLGQGNHLYVTEGVPGMDKISENKREELFLMVWIFTHGIASMVANNRVELSDDELRKLLIKAYNGFALIEEEEM